MGSFVGIGFAESIAVELADADTAMLWFALCLTTISVSLFFPTNFSLRTLGVSEVTAANAIEYIAVSAY